MLSRIASLPCVRRLRTLHVRRVTRMSSRSQRGAVSILAAVWVSVAVITMAAIDIGHFYYVRRDLQRIADLAAAAGVQTIGSAGSCTAAINSAQLNATKANGLPSNGSIQSTCGRWDPSANAAPSYFVAAGTPLNALQVVVSQPVSFLFLIGQTRTLTATATAQATNIRSFSLSTSVASLSGGMINGLLNALLNTNLNLDVASYQGLATAQIKLLDLATALGVSSMNDLLNAQVTVAQLAKAMATVLGQGNIVSANVTNALNTIASVSTGTTTIHLGNTSSQNGLLAVGLGDPQAAATATVNALDVLMAAAEIANGTSAINLGTALNLSPIASVTAQAQVIQPPVIAVGEAGTYPDGSYRTSAHSAVVRLYLNVALLNLSIPLVATINALNLPIYVEVGQGNAYLQTTQCSTQLASSYSWISTTPGVAALCIGGDAASNMTNTTVPTSCNQPAQITSVSLPLLGLGLANVSVQSASGGGLNLNVQSPSATVFKFNGVQGDSDDYQTTNTNGLGSAVGGLLAQLASGLSGTIHVTVLGVDVTGVAAPLVNGLVTLLTPVLQSLDALLIPLLQLLGVQIGVATVHDLGLACGQAQLVN
ncbi:TadG family pilus assembly protein [Paraburkholderia aspalathi]|uniref:TadG family pilus assembly protein n=1 Tax=Paraburkholderia aspalathi TaxID=1324617 RepID=UPI0038B7C2EC